MKGRDLLILAGVLLRGRVRRGRCPAGYGDLGAPRGAADDDRARDDVDRGGTGDRSGFRPCPEREATSSSPRSDRAPCARSTCRPASSSTGVVQASTCELWAAPVTAKVAVGIGEPRGDAVPFRFLDLANPNRELGGGEALFGALSGARTASGRPGAPVSGWASTSSSAPAGASFRTARAPIRPKARSSTRGAIACSSRTGRACRRRGRSRRSHYGSDGSVAVVVEGRRIERYVDGKLTDALDLQERFHGRLPTLSPDNCSAAYRAGDRIRILDVGCSRLGPGGTIFPGHVAAWSPNGDWIAIGGADRADLLRPVGPAEPVVWPVGAVQIAWRRG